MPAARFLAPLAFALLAGCGPVGTTYTYMGATLPGPKPNEGRVFFYTPKVGFGGDVQPEIRLNGVIVGFAVPSGFFYVDRPAGRYEATGKLGIKGVTRDVTVPFSVKDEAGRRVFESTFPLKRLDYRIGEGEWADTKTLANETTVNVRLVMTSAR